MTCKSSSLKLLPWLGKLQDDCGSEIVTALLPSLHIDGRSCQVRQQPRLFCLWCPAQFDRDFVSSRERRGEGKEKKTREGIICSVCPSLSVSGALKWIVILPFISLGEIRQAHMYKLRPSLFPFLSLSCLS